ncbi:hypothetical protein Peur_042829 [Populus x canadensis]
MVKVLDCLSLFEQGTESHLGSLSGCPSLGAAVLESLSRLVLILQGLANEAIISCQKSVCRFRATSFWLLMCSSYERNEAWEIRVRGVHFLYTFIMLKNLKWMMPREITKRGQKTTKSGTVYKVGDV